MPRSPRLQRSLCAPLLVFVAVLMLGVGVAVPAGAQLPGVASAGAGPTTPWRTGVVSVSNERTVTYWANPLTDAAIHSGPSGSSRVLAHLHAFTEDNYPEVYIILARQTVSGTVWAHVAYPGRPNGGRGWVPLDDLLVPQLDTEHLVISLSGERATLYRRGGVIFSAPVGIGSPAAPTPTGTFWIREKFAVAGDAAYGPYAFGTSAYSSLADWPGGGVAGIHGTDQPSLVPGNPSHGCVRLRNSDIARLYGLMSVGTPVTVER